MLTQYTRPIASSHLTFKNLTVYYIMQTHTISSNILNCLFEFAGLIAVIVLLNPFFFTSLINIKANRARVHNNDCVFVSHIVRAYSSMHLNILYTKHNIHNIHIRLQMVYFKKKKKFVFYVTFCFSLELYNDSIEMVVFIVVRVIR